MIDEKSLLVGIPEFNNPEKYLKASKMTDHNNQEVQEAARAKGIPAMQIISVDEYVARKNSGTECKITDGHFLHYVDKICKKR